MSKADEKVKLAVEALELAIKLIQLASRLTEGRHGIYLGRAHTAIDEARVEVLET
jgi:hypothetical protein